MVASTRVSGKLSIIDIRRIEMTSSILCDVKHMLRPAPGVEKRMPTMLLYDEAGLKLFEEITYLKEYYLTNAEIEVLETYADAIAARIPRGSQVIELGSGNLRKVNILLKALDRAQKDVDYYALDLSLSELERTLAAVPPGTFRHVKCHGLHGTYDDGLAWLKRPENLRRSKCIMTLGSSIGNFEKAHAGSFLKGFADVLRKDDIILVGLDACQDKDKVYIAYNDPQGKTHEFVRNGLTHVNRLLGWEAFKHEDWEVLGEYDVTGGRHQAFYIPVKDIEVDGVYFQAGERVKIEESNKYSTLESDRLWNEAGLAAGAIFGDHTGEYNIHLLSPAEVTFPLDPTDYAATPIPTLREFEQLWVAWDLVTRHMIPHEELLSKPINLRHCCLFYLGHIPTFLDIHLTRATNGIPTEPSSYSRIFERGIDPDVEDPSKCHDHSEIPDTWPPADEIVAFQARVRDRTRSFYKNGTAETDSKLGRALWLGFEHEAMHLETLLYMLLQSEKTVAPPGVLPDFESLAARARAQSTPNEWIIVPESRISIGLDNPENTPASERHLGWDNEEPVRSVTVPAFEAKARGITNEEYAVYLQESKTDKFPASWIAVTPDKVTPKKNSALQKKINGQLANGHSNGLSNGYSNGYANGHGKRLTDAFLDGKKVRTVYGPVPLTYALDWPVIASYDELAGCAKWMNGRIPTMEELRSIYNYAEIQKTKDVSEVSAENIPAVNGHLSNNGVEESPPSHHCSNGFSSTEKKLDPGKLFVNLESCNVGFKHFHPMPTTHQGNKLSGQGELGGVWEWSSSVLEKYDGFKAMALYPGYTADFFDGKHNICLGGSWATHPRIAGRMSFVNWYQRNYPYAWTGARLVRDIKKATNGRSSRHANGNI